MLHEEYNKVGSGGEHEAGCNVLKGWSGKALLRQQHLGKDMKEMTGWATWVPQR